jgi:hypothetical protein
MNFNVAKIAVKPCQMGLDINIIVPILDCVAGK